MSGPVAAPVALAALNRLACSGPELRRAVPANVFALRASPLLIIAAPCPTMERRNALWYRSVAHLDRVMSSCPVGLPVRLGDAVRSFLSSFSALPTKDWRSPLQHPRPERRGRS